MNEQFTAKKVRNRVRSILRYEDSGGEMRKLQRAFQQALFHDLKDDDFADMLAQTVVLQPSRRRSRYCEK